MKAKTDIPHGYAFHVPGINSRNPMTREDTGFPAVFACIGGVKAGEEVAHYTPAMFATGIYSNVTREATPEDEAIEGWPTHGTILNRTGARIEQP